MAKNLDRITFCYIFVTGSIKLEPANLIEY